MEKLLVFAPWHVLGLSVAALLVIAQAVAAIAKRIRREKAKQALIYGHSRRYVCTFTNQKGY